MVRGTFHLKVATLSQDTITSQATITNPRDNSQVKETFHRKAMMRIKSMTTIQRGNSQGRRISHHKVAKLIKNLTTRQRRSQRPQVPLTCLLHHYNICQQSNNYWTFLNNNVWISQPQYLSKFVHSWHHSFRKSRGVVWLNYCSSGEVSRHEQ